MAGVTAASPSGAAPFLGWRAQRRPHPGFAHVLGAAAGGFAVVAMVAFVAAIDEDDPRVPGVILTAVLIVAALAAGLRGPGPLRSACTTILVLTVPLLWIAALVGDGNGNGNGGRDEVRGVLLLTLLGYAALYLLTWTKGRAVLLAGSLITFSSWIAFEIAGNGTGGFSSNGVGSTSTPFGSTDDTTTTGVLMLVGIAFLVVGGLLDQRRLSGAATPFLAIGAYDAIFGGIALGATESTLVAGIVAVLIGGAVGLIGAAGRDRRATTWIGVLTVFGGLVAILVDIAPDSTAGTGAIAAAFAVALGALAWWLAPVLREPDDGNDTAEHPPPAPADGDTARLLGEPLPGTFPS